MQMEASPDEEDAVTLEIKSDIQLILSALCENDMHRKVKLEAWEKHFGIYMLKSLWNYFNLKPLCDFQIILIKSLVS